MIASNAYSQPRATVDADFMVSAAPEAFQRLFDRLQTRLVKVPQSAFETVTGKAQHKFLDPASKFLIEIFEANMVDPLEASRFARRRAETIMGRSTWFPTPEDVIVGKLRWLRRINRAKDRADLLLVLR